MAQLGLNFQWYTQITVGRDDGGSSSIDDICPRNVEACVEPQFKLLRVEGNGLQTVAVALRFANESKTSGCKIIETRNFRLQEFFSK